MFFDFMKQEKWISSLSTLFVCDLGGNAKDAMGVHRWNKMGTWQDEEMVHLPDHESRTDNLGFVLQHFPSAKTEEGGSEPEWQGGSEKLLAEVCSTVPGAMPSPASCQ